MSVTPRQMWEHAKALPQNTETEMRAKISRLYYALFSHACEFNSQLPSEGQLLKKDAGSHHQLFQKLTNPTVAENALQTKSRELGTKQKLAHELRVKADYELDEEVNKADVAKCVRYVDFGMEISVADSEPKTGTICNTGLNIRPIKKK